jgi:hypothetical protein
MKVSKLDEFCDVLSEAIESNRPWLVDLEVDPGGKVPSVGTYPGLGITLGPVLTFGYLVAKHAWQEK